MTENPSLKFYTPPEITGFDHELFTKNIDAPVIGGNLLKKLKENNGLAIHNSFDSQRINIFIHEKLHVEKKPFCLIDTSTNSQRQYEVHFLKNNEETSEKFTHISAALELIRKLVLIEYIKDFSRNMRKIISPNLQNYLWKYLSPKTWKQIEEISPKPQRNIRLLCQKIFSPFLIYKAPIQRNNLTKFENSLNNHLLDNKKLRDIIEEVFLFIDNCPPENSEMMEELNKRIYLIRKKADFIISDEWLAKIPCGEETFTEETKKAILACLNNPNLSNEDFKIIVEYLLLFVDEIKQTAINNFSTASFTQPPSLPSSLTGYNNTGMFGISTPTSKSPNTTEVEDMEIENEAGKAMQELEEEIKRNKLNEVIARMSMHTHTYKN